ncbi:hypothetical protein [Serratia sp. 2723]|uniref:hypothetical protein n=1 Tax=unclassified Serratia (in: enterobacteria) TaxID=2647522 RepID=UPI003D1B9A34
MKPGGGDVVTNDLAIEEQQQQKVMNGGIYGLTPFTLSLTECFGAGAPENYSQTPGIKVDGETTTTSDYLFRVSTGQNQADPRFGFVVRTEDDTSGNTPSWNVNKQAKKGEVVSTKFTTQQLLNDNNADRKTVNFWVGLSCGDTIMCNAGAPPTPEGVLDANILFSFEYK